MNDRTAQCPTCGRQIFRHAQVCPYCKGETHFASIDDEASQQRIETASPKAPEPRQPMQAETLPPETAGHDDTQATHEQKRRMGKYIDHLRHDKEKVQEEVEKVREKYEEKIGRRYSRANILIGTVIGILAITVLCLYIAVQMMQRETFGRDTSVDREMKLVIDSVENRVLQDSKILAKFPDRKRHCLIYLRENRLHYFDGATKADSLWRLTDLNPQAIVDDEGGILDAYLSPSEQYVMMIVSRTPGNTECGLYRLDLLSRQLDVIDQGQVVREKDGFKVSSGRRTAEYNAAGDKVRGLTGREMEAIEAEEAAAAAAAEKAKAERERAERERAREKTEESKPVVSTERVSERVASEVSVIPQKPAVPAATEKITIKPVKTE